MTMVNPPDAATIARLRAAVGGAVELDDATISVIWQAERADFDATAAEMARQLSVIAARGADRSEAYLKRARSVESPWAFSKPITEGAGTTDALTAVVTDDTLEGRGTTPSPLGINETAETARVVALIRAHAAPPNPLAASEPALLSYVAEELSMGTREPIEWSSDANEYLDVDTTAAAAGGFTYLHLSTDAGTLTPVLIDNDALLALPDIDAEAEPTLTDANSLLFDMGQGIDMRVAHERTAFTFVFDTAHTYRGYIQPIMPLQQQGGGGLASVLTEDPVTGDGTADTPVTLTDAAKASLARPIPAISTNAPTNSPGMPTAGSTGLVSDAGHDHGITPGTGGGGGSGDSGWERVGSATIGSTASSLQATGYTLPDEGVVGVGYTTAVRGGTAQVFGTMDVQNIRALPANAAGSTGGNRGRLSLSVDRGVESTLFIGRTAANELLIGGLGSVGGVTQGLVVRVYAPAAGGGGAGLTDAQAAQLQSAVDFETAMKDADILIQNESVRVAIGGAESSFPSGTDVPGASEDADLEIVVGTTRQTFKLSTLLALPVITGATQSASNSLVLNNTDDAEMYFIGRGTDGQFKFSSDTVGDYTISITHRYIQFPASFVRGLPTGGGGLTQAQVEALIADPAQEGNTDRWAKEKLPADVAYGVIPTFTDDNGYRWTMANGVWTLDGGFEAVTTLPTDLTDYGVGDMLFQRGVGSFAVGTDSGASGTLTVSSWTPAANHDSTSYGFNLNPATPSGEQYGTRPTGFSSSEFGLWRDDDNRVWVEVSPGTFGRQDILLQVTGGASIDLKFDQTAAGHDNFFSNELASAPWTTSPIGFTIHVPGAQPFVSSAKHWTLVQRLVNPPPIATQSTPGVVDYDQLDDRYALSRDAIPSVDRLPTAPTDTQRVVLLGDDHYPRYYNFTPAAGTTQGGDAIVSGTLPVSDDYTTNLIYYPGDTAGQRVRLSFGGTGWSTPSAVHIGTARGSVTRRALTQYQSNPNEWYLVGATTLTAGTAYLVSIEYANASFTPAYVNVPGGWDVTWDETDQTWVRTPGTFNVVPTRPSVLTLIDGVTPGISLLSSGQGSPFRTAFTPFSPAFDVNADANMRGVYEVSGTLILPDSITPVPTDTGLGTDKESRLSISGITFAGDVRDSTAYSNTATNGVRIGSWGVHAGTTLRETLNLYLAIDGNGHAGYYIEKVNVVGQTLVTAAFQLHLSVAFLHDEPVPESGGGVAASRTEILSWTGNQRLSGRSGVYTIPTAISPALTDDDDAKMLEIQLLINADGHDNTSANYSAFTVSVGSFRAGALTQPYGYWNGNSFYEASSFGVSLVGGQLRFNNWHSQTVRLRGARVYLITQGGAQGPAGPAGPAGGAPTLEAARGRYTTQITSGGTPNRGGNQFLDRGRLRAATGLTLSVTPIAATSVITVELRGGVVRRTNGDAFVELRAGTSRINNSKYSDDDGINASALSISASHTPGNTNAVTYSVYWYSNDNTHITATLSNPIVFAASDSEGNDAQIVFTGWPSLSAYANYTLKVNSAGTGFELVAP